MKPNPRIRLAALVAMAVQTAPYALAGTFDIGNNSFNSAPSIHADEDYTGNDTSSATNITAFTKQVGEPGHGSDGDDAAKHTAWWTWTAPADGYCTVDTLRTAEADNGISDTVLAVYTGNAVNALTLVGRNDDHSALQLPNKGLSRVTFMAKKDTTYRIAADAYNIAYIDASHFNLVLQLRHLKFEAGSKAGAFMLSSNPQALKMGMITVTNTPSGGLSGKLFLSAKTYSFAGKYGGSGYFQASFPQKGPGNTPLPPITLTLDGTGEGIFEIDAGNGEAGYGLMAPKLVFNKQLVNPTVGTYPLYLDHGGNADVGGEGVATLTIKANGTVTAAGTNPDGVAFTFSTAIHKRNSANFAELPAFRSLAGGKSLMLVIAGLNENGNVDQIDNGSGIYFRAPAPAAKLYPQGLFYSFEMTGSSYVKPVPGKRALGFLDGNQGAGTMTVTNSGGELQNNLVDVLNLSLQNKFTFAAATNKPSLTLNTANGTVTGAITEPGGKKRNIKGVLTYTNGEPYIRGHVTGSTRSLAFKVTP